MKMRLIQIKETVMTTITAPGIVTCGPNEALVISGMCQVSFLIRTPLFLQKSHKSDEKTESPINKPRIPARKCKNTLFCNVDGEMSVLNI